MVAKRTKEILRRLDEVYTTEYKCYLEHDSAWQLLIATILSAQCTDARVNIVTKDLFRKYPTIEAFAGADVDELEQDIKSTGFYHNKARNIIGCCRKLVYEFHGEVPRSIEELTSLPGVGRKTANVVFAVGFGGQAMPVDTHVFRVAHRLGLSQGKTPDAVERDLRAVIPEHEYTHAHHLFIFHGRYTCKARMPLCDICKVQKWCDEFNGRENDTKH